MRMIITAALSLSLFATAHAQTPSATSSPIKVEYVQDIPVSGFKKLLGMGMSADRLYIAKKNGSVDVLSTDKDGKVLLTLQAKDHKGEAVLKQPEGVAVSNGTIYVLDSEQSRVAMFSADGKYKGGFGKKGSGIGELDSPRGIAFYEGIIYVADTGNSRIQMFGDNGVFLTTLSIDSAPANKALQDKKDIPFKLDKPTAVAIDSMGQIYALDAGRSLFSDSSLIKVYSQDGSYVKHLPKSGKPSDMDMTQDSLYVADQDNFTIQKYDGSGKLVSYFGSKGEGRGQFMSLSGIAMDHGYIFVGDSTRGVIHRFLTSAPSAPIAAPKPTAIPFVRWQESIPASVGRMAWDGKDTLYGVTRDKAAVVRIRNGEVAGELKLKDITPAAVAVDRSGALWVVDRRKSRIVKLDSAGNITLSFGTSGSRNGQFDDPSDLAISSEGNIYVADTGNNRIQAFSNDGVFFKVISSGLNGKLKKPGVISLDPRDNLYVLDTSRASVTVYSPNGDALHEFGNDKTNEADSLKDPTSLMATHEEVFVIDADRIRVYSQEGKYQRAFGAPGKENGEFADADNITMRDATTFFISERGNKRIQVYTTLYKPKPPEQVAAAGVAHAVELSWTASALPYVAQYNIYRSRNEKGGFVQVGSSKTNHFVDQGLPPEERYYYRVAAQTGAGHEGMAGLMAGGITKKYTPPPLENIQAAPASTRLKISWNPLDARYVTSYLVYQKDTDGNYRKIAETASPEFLKEGLTPGTAYTFYLSAHSVDGIESEKIPFQASTVVDTRTPLDIDVAELRNVFSNTYKLYEQDGVGQVKLTNNTSNPQVNIKVSFVLNNFMDYPTETKIDTLLPGESKEVTLKAVFNNNILTLTEDTPVQAKLEASYFENGQPKVYSKIKTINIYDKHRLSWDERGRYAAFITPKDPLLINFVRSVASEFGTIKEPTQLAAAVFDTMGALGVTYAQDPANPYQITSSKIDTVDYIQYPRETMQRKSGDCDDLVALYSASLESLGIPTRVLLVPGHMFMMFGTGIEADSDGYTMNDMYVIHDGTLWIPVETTLVGKPFAKAWEVGAAAYYKDKNRDLAIFDTHEAWLKYKPASLPEDSWKPATKNREAIDKAFPSDLMSVLKISSQTRTRRYLQAIQKNPEDMGAHLQLGIILARQGDREEASKYFHKILETDPKNAAALNNQGNLYMLDGQFPNAQKSYAESAKADPNDAEVLVNLANAYKAGNNVDKAKEAFAKAQKMDPEIANRHKALSLELMSTLSTSKRKPARSKK